MFVSDSFRFGFDVCILNYIDQKREFHAQVILCLPVNQGIIIGAVILDLKHADSRNTPVEVKLDQS